MTSTISPLAPEEKRSNNLPATLLRVWTSRDLIWLLVKRDIMLQYRDTAMGWVWLIATPLVLLGVYSFIFLALYNVGRTASHNGMEVSYPLVVFSGLILFHVFADCFGAAPTLIKDNVNLVKKNIFPIEIIAFVSVISSLLRGAIGLALLILFYIAFEGMVSFTILFVPIIWAMFGLFLIGMIWLFSSIGLVLRDIAPLFRSVTIVIMLASPIFYNIDKAPDHLQFWLLLNPLAGYIELTRQAVIWNEVPSLTLLLIHGVGSVFMLWLGHLTFFRLRPYFADLL